VPHGPDHVGVRDERATVMGNTMLQHSPSGVPMFMHTNLGKPTGWVPATEHTYVRRWVVSLLHGREVQLDPIKPTLKAPGTKRLKLKCDRLLQNLLSISTYAATARRGVPPGDGPGRGGGRLRDVVLPPHPWSALLLR
jgi:hypothetical protein